ncbi:MAG: hypothetical protein K0R26_1939 [Bacteroidota bacterium]|nr:hypothetical protein [Bacteroidota bacterium]
MKCNMDCYLMKLAQQTSKNQAQTIQAQQKVIDLLTLIIKRSSIDMTHSAEALKTLTKNIGLN